MGFKIEVCARQTTGFVLGPGPRPLTKGLDSRLLEQIPCFSCNQSRVVSHLGQLPTFPQVFSITSSAASLLSWQHTVVWQRLKTRKSERVTAKRDYAFWKNLWPEQKTHFVHVMSHEPIKSRVDSIRTCSQLRENNYQQKFFSGKCEFTCRTTNKVNWFRVWKGQRKVAVLFGFLSLSPRNNRTCEQALKHFVLSRALIDLHDFITTLLCVYLPIWRQWVQTKFGTSHSVKKRKKENVSFSCYVSGKMQSESAAIWNIHTARKQERVRVWCELGVFLSGAFLLCNVALGSRSLVVVWHGREAGVFMLDGFKGWGLSCSQAKIFLENTTPSHGAHALETMTPPPHVALGLETFDNVNVQRGIAPTVSLHCFLFWQNFPLPCVERKHWCSFWPFTWNVVRRGEIRNKNFTCARTIFATQRQESQSPDHWFLWQREVKLDFNRSNVSCFQRLLWPRTNK